MLDGKMNTRFLPPGFTKPVIRLLRILVVAVSLSLLSFLCCRAEEAAPALRVSIAIPNSKRELPGLHWSFKEGAPKFQVFLTNISTVDQNVFQDWNSWGFFALSFELTDAKGKVWRVQKTERDWTKNFPSFWTLKPQESHVFEIDFSDRSTWGDGFWNAAKPPTGHASLTAFYRVGPDENSKKLGVWTGSLVSGPAECFIK